MLKQNGKNNCGETVVRNILRIKLHRREAYFYEIKNDCKTFLEMKETLKMYNASVKGYVYDNYKFLKNIKHNYIERLKIDDKYHYVIVIKRLIFGIFIFDPAIGYRYILKSNFLKLSTHEILDCSITNKREIPRFKLLNMKEKVLLFIINLCEFIALLGLLTIKFISTQFIVSIVILSILFVMYVLHKSYILTLSNRLDLRVIYPYIQVEKSREDYVKINDFKVSYLKNYNDKITSIFVLVFTLIYCIFLDVKTVIFITILSLLLGAVYYSFNKIISIKNYTVFELENEFLNDDKRELNKFKNIISESKSYAVFYVVLKSVILLLIFTFISLFNMENYNFLSVIFATIFYNFLFESVVNLFSSFSLKNEGLSEIMHVSSKIYRILVDN